MKDHESGEPESRSIELELVRKSGDTYWVEVRAKLAKEYGGRPKIIGITRDITTRKRAELQLEKLNQEQFAALADKERLVKKIKVLHKLLPICSGCRRIRDDEGKWWPLDEYVRVHTDSDFTHTICPECKDIFYPGIKNNPDLPAPPFPAGVTAGRRGPVAPYCHPPVHFTCTHLRIPTLDISSITVYEQRGVWRQGAVSSPCLTGF